MKKPKILLVLLVLIVLMTSCASTSKSKCRPCPAYGNESPKYEKLPY